MPDNERPDLWKQSIDAVLAHRGIEAALMRSTMTEILDGKLSPARIAALAVALRMKGESVAELAAAAQAMRDRCVSVQKPDEGIVMDTCGTGGDGQGTFNVSTLSAIALAACGVKVAKHGNRAVSSKCGSADVLQALGVNLEQPIDKKEASLHTVGLCFLFAPQHHPAMKHAAPVRKDLGLRTFFNLLGPLTNPASVEYQLLGVYTPGRTAQLAEVLGQLGAKRAWVVCGQEGIDEVSPEGATQVSQWDQQQLQTFEIRPEHFGLEPFSLKEIEGGDAERNAAIATKVFAGQKSRFADMVVLNTAAALCACGLQQDYRAAAELASESIFSGAAAKKLHEWVEFSHS